MTANTYTEEEFKQVLKNLFAEKKRVKELQKQLEEKGIQKKFQAKLADIHKLSLAEEYAKLKSAYLEKEKEGEHLKKQLEKVRPALKKLVEELKTAQREVATLKAQPTPPSEHFRKALEEAHQKIKAFEEQKRLLEEEKKRLAQEEGIALDLQKQIVQLEEELERVRKKNGSLEEGQQTFDLKIEAMAKMLEEERGELARAKANEQKEASRFESERSRLVERLAESLSQVQRQAEMINDVREELAASQKKMQEYEQQGMRSAQEMEQLKSELAQMALEASRVNKIAEFQLATLKDEKEQLQGTIVKLQQAAEVSKEAMQAQISHWEKKEERYLQLQAELEKVQAQLQRSDIVLLSSEYEAKLKEAIAHRDQAKEEAAAAQERFASQLMQKEAAQEEILERSYVKMREFSEKHASLVQERELLQKKIGEEEKLLAKFEKEQVTLQTALKNAKLQCEERDGEIRKAQQHLAKKVKETTILRDLVERQKAQLVELQTLCDKQKNETERIQNSLNLQRMHEEKLQEMAKERVQAAERLTKEWQEKYLSLQQEWHEKKAELIELQKMRKTYDQMTSTFTSLKTILGNSLEPPSTEQPHHPGN
jgi:chromosome segregation ATPase